MSFDELALAYDNSIDWNARLKREMPYLLSLLPETGQVLDVACGSGHHSLAFAEKNHTVTGFDSSEVMIQSAKRLAIKKELNVDFQVRNMLDVDGIVDSEFDLIICLGNSFALLPSFEDLQQVLSSLSSLLMEDGYFVLQVLNFEEILASRFRYFPLKGGTTLDGKQVIFGRFYEHHEHKNYSTLIATSFLKEEAIWSTRISTHKVLQLNENRIRSLLASAGFKDIVIHSNYQGKEFSPLTDRNMIVRASRFGG
jgi:2-polyprenyl-3-methyl-5-hydroxy-6-metoxy-1,4-benzoquinol methylase